MGFEFSERELDLIEQCRVKLVGIRQDLLNRAVSSYQDFVYGGTKSGDEGDQSSAQTFEDNFLIGNRRLQEQLLEINEALARIDHGAFGLCEETGEPIEHDRLLAIPQTRLSIEGAEMRESSLGRTDCGYKKIFGI